MGTLSLRAGTQSCDLKVKLYGFSALCQQSVCEIVCGLRANAKAKVQLTNRSFISQ